MPPPQSPPSNDRARACFVDLSNEWHPPGTRLNTSVPGGERFVKNFRTMALQRVTEPLIAVKLPAQRRALRKTRQPAAGAAASRDLPFILDQTIESNLRKSR